jgi:replicative DNA helicase
MSDGLKLISAILVAGATGALSSIDREQLLDQEVQAYDFVRRHLRSYRDLPAAGTVFQETNIRLPTATETVQYYLDQVGDRYDYNQIRERFGSFREAIQNKDLETVASTVSNMSRVLQRRRRGPGGAGEALAINDALRLVSDRLSSIQFTGGISGVLTNWALFDHITGGYQKSDLITWVGRMGLGKTYVLLKQAIEAHAAGHSVLFITTEMGTEQIGRRYAALVTGCDPNRLKTGMVSTYMQRRLQGLYREMMGAERFKIYAVGMAAKIDSIANMVYEFGPDIVFIDGVYLLRPTELNRNASRVDKVTGVFDELRALNLDANIPFVVSTQFNRQAGKGGKEGTLETIGYSDAIGTHSSHVIAMRPGPTENPRDSREFEFLKGREGEHGSVVINFKFAPLDMNEMTPEEREAEGEVTESTTSWMLNREAA